MNHASFKRAQKQNIQIHNGSTVYTDTTAAPVDRTELSELGTGGCRVDCVVSAIASREAVCGRR